jgi:hypothetical protein
MYCRVTFNANFLDRKDAMFMQYNTFHLVVDIQRISNLAQVRLLSEVRYCILHGCWGFLLVESKRKSGSLSHLITFYVLNTCI